MKDLQPKGKQGSVSTSESAALMASKAAQATQEQIQFAKLAQQSGSYDDQELQSKIREVSEITRKSHDIVSVALHDCGFDTQQAIHELFSGKYDDLGEWKTTSASRSKRAPSQSQELPAPETDRLIDQITEIEVPEQKPPIKPTRLSRGPINAGFIRGHSSSRGREGNTHVGRRPAEQHVEKSQFIDRDVSPGRLRSSTDRDRGRGRGRGRGRSGPPFRGGFRGRGFRGSFGRGVSRGRGRPYRGGYYGRQREGHSGKGEELPVVNGEDAPGIGDENWAEEAGDSRVDDWEEDVDEGKDGNEDWSKNEWSEESPVVSSAAGNLFAVPLEDSSENWSQANGTASLGWEDQALSSRSRQKPLDGPESAKYLPENVDTAVIRSHRSVPTSSAPSEVTAYQSTNDMTRYLSSQAATSNLHFSPSSPSNQFPSSHQEGGLTSSLSDRTFTESIAGPALTPYSQHTGKRPLGTMPVVSGVTDSQKLEEEQLRAPRAAPASAKPRKAHQQKAVELPNQPVQMPPRSAEMVNEIEQQLCGLEFGNGPITSAGLTFNQGSQLFTPVESIKTSVFESSSRMQTSSGVDMSQRHPKAPVPQQTVMSSQAQNSQRLVSPQVQSSSKLMPSSGSLDSSSSKTEKPKTPPGLKRSDPELQASAAHYLNPSGRGLDHLVPEPLQLPSKPPGLSKSENLPDSALHSYNLLRASLGGMAATGNVDHPSYPSLPRDQGPSPGTVEPSFNEKKASERLSEHRAASEQRLLTESKYFTDHGRELQWERERAMVEQRTVSEQKHLVEQQRQFSEPRALTEQRPSNDKSTQNSQRGPSSDRINKERGNLADARHPGDSRLPESRSVADQLTDNLGMGITGTPSSSSRSLLGTSHAAVAKGIGTVSNVSNITTSKSSDRAASSAAYATQEPSKTAQGVAGRASTAPSAVASTPTASTPAASISMSASASSSSGAVSSQVAGLASTTALQTTAKLQQTSSGKTDTPPNVLPLNLYAGMQPGMIPYAQMHYGYDDQQQQLQMLQHMPAGVSMSPYQYDLPLFHAAPQGAGRDGMQAYQGVDGKYARGIDVSTPVASLNQGNLHPPGHPQQQAFLGPASHLQYGYTYAYNPSVLPQAGIYQAFPTAPVYQVPSGKESAGPSYQPQYQSPQQTQSYTSRSSGGQEFTKQSYGGSPVGISQAKTTQAVVSTVASAPVSGHPPSFKSQQQYGQEGSKGYLSTSPGRMHPAQAIPVHNQPHIGLSPYMVQHGSMLPHGSHGVVSGPHLAHQPTQLDSPTHVPRTQAQSAAYATGQQAKRDNKSLPPGTGYQSFWSGSR